MNFTSLIPPVSQPKLKPLTPNEFRPEIQGIRLISALLVASFHIWGNAVSGGVDVFFVLSGYFLGRGLIKNNSNDFSFSASNHINRFIGRTVPEVTLVLAACFMATILLMSPASWETNLKNLFFSSLYLENFWLIRQSTDYFARSESASIVQHFWAISIIAQVYVSWIGTVLAARLCERLFGVAVIKAVLAIVVITGTASLAWGLYFTTVNPSAAYFDPASRYWQFAVGAISALISSRIIGPNRVLSFIGFGLIFSCGFAIGSRLPFPGVASIWPVSGAILVLLFAGHSRSIMTSILSHSAVVRAGGLGFGVYLWHWPIYIMYLNLTSKAPDIWAGLTIILLSFLLSWGGLKLISQSKRATFKRSFVCLSCLGLISVASLGIFYATKRVPHLVDQTFISAYPNRAYSPGPLAARTNLPDNYSDGCHVSVYDSIVRTCTYNETGAAGVVHIVGGSHAAQWLPALQIAAQELDFVLKSSTKSACTFAEPDYVTHLERLSAAEPFDPSCATWNSSLIEEIMQSDVDYVFAIGTRAFLAQPRKISRPIIAEDSVPEGYAHIFTRLVEAGIGVIAVRDNPLMGFDVLDCVYRINVGSDENACTRVRNEVLPSTRENLGLPTDIHFIDLSDSMCNEATCEGTRDGVVIYKDSHHLTTDFVLTLSDQLTESIKTLMLASEPAN